MSEHDGSSRTVEYPRLLLEEMDDETLERWRESIKEKRTSLKHELDKINDVLKEREQ